jgi:putative nucleotidyltransferase with HDIG domain
MTAENPLSAGGAAFDEPERLSRIMGARRVLRQLDASCGRINPVGPGYPPARDGRDIWLTSGLLYFVAAADPRVDLAAHSRSAARYAVLLARAIGIDQTPFLLDLERGALLHDVGKAVVPGEILRRSGPLSVVEREIVREHPVVGYRMIEEFGFLRPASEIVLCHHERFDGRGYPRGLAGDEIPLGARVFALADTLDALTSDRPYRRGKSFEEAFREIERSSGSQFDPRIVDGFMSVPGRMWEKAKAEIRGSLRPASIL